MVHTAYTFGLESNVARLDISHEDFDNGCLVKLIQRGLQYMELEANSGESTTFEVLTAADILKAKSTEDLKALVRERRDDREEERCNGEEKEARAVPQSAIRLLPADTRGTFQAEWNQNGTILATYGPHRVAHLWHAGTSQESERGEGTRVTPLLHGRDDAVACEVTALAWARDGAHVATARSDGTISVWNTEGAFLPPLHDDMWHRFQRAGGLPLEQFCSVNFSARYVLCSQIKRS
jgi:WD40 repeat protein